MILYSNCKEKFCLGHSWELYGQGQHNLSATLAQDLLFQRLFHIIIFLVSSESLTNDLTHGVAFENLAHDEMGDIARPRSGSLPAVQFAEDSGDSDKEVSRSEILKYRLDLLPFLP